MSFQEIEPVAIKPIRQWRRVAANHHPLMHELDLLQIRTRVDSHTLAERSGISREGIWRWKKKGNMPNIANFDAVLRAMGFKLVIRRIEEPTQ